jgi:myo-inositol-1(or 4)-monophosphatase
VTDELTDLTRIAEQAAGLGYDIIKNTTPAEIRLKGDRDVVTDVGFLGEEETSTARLDDDQDVWTLDPVDGTSNFAHGLPLCAISLALVRHGEPIAAPFLDLRYVAAKGRGSLRERHSATGEQGDQSRRVDRVHRRLCGRRPSGQQERAPPTHHDPSRPAS